MPVDRNPFDDISRTARGHLGLLFYEAAHRIVHYLHSRAVTGGDTEISVFERYPFLHEYFETIRPRLPDGITWNQSLGWFRDTVEDWERAATGWLPLVAMRAQGKLSRDAVIAFITCGLVEEEAGFAGLFADLQPSLGHRRPTVTLLQELAGGEATEMWMLSEELVGSGFVEVQDADAPRSEWVLRVPGALWAAVRGRPQARAAPALRHLPAESLDLPEELALSEAQRARIAALPPLLASARARGVVVRGGFGSERAAVARSVARAIGSGVVEHDGPVVADAAWRLLGPLCTLAGAVPVLTLDPAPGETIEVPALLGYAGPLIVVMGHDGGVSGPGAESSVTLHLEPEGPGDRLVAWRRALGDKVLDDLPGIADEYALGGRYIREAARIATAHAGMAHRDRVTRDDIRLAARSLNHQLLDTLATRLEPVGGWDVLVGAGDTLRALRTLAHRCRYRERLESAISDGIPGGVNRGVRALFEGPSGCGKSLAARVIATAELGLDLYRVDLAAVVNKYIGETEKNLSRVLGRAEELNVALLLDEGDSLMTRRTEVRSSNDRYANLETNYLLQRLDTYTGVLFVTTNSAATIDSAFRRRFDSVVKFHLPDANQRLQLWETHLAGHSLGPDALESIAYRHPLTGGQIRNASVAAALSAVSRPDRITRHDVETAIRVEYEKAGASYPGNELSPDDDHQGSLAAFLDAIT